MIAFITYVFPTEVGEFINSIYPNAGYYVVRAAFVVASCYLVVMVVYELYKRLRQESTTKAQEPSSEREKEDFRNGVATEVYFLLKKFTDPLHHWDISYPSWSSKADESKAAILGKEDYLVLRALYDAIEERNSYFTRRRGMNLAELDPLNRTCIEAFSRAYGEVTWLKISSDTDSLLSIARKGVRLP